MLEKAIGLSEWLAPVDHEVDFVDNYGFCPLPELGVGKVIVVKLQTTCDFR
jgi:hypothetical protein